MPAETSPPRVAPFLTLRSQLLRKRPPQAARALAFGAWLGLLLLVSGMAQAATISNPSFEANTFTVAPGTVSANTPIAGWVASDPTRVGLNPVNGVDHFADNGRIPHGSRVAFIRSQGSTVTLSTTITGLFSGSHYKVSFRVNRRTGAAAFSSCRVSGGPWVSLGDITPVDGAGVHSNNYRLFTTYFVAQGATALLEINNNTSSDTALLLDDFRIEAATPLQVTSAANDGPGSLAAAIDAAALTPAFNVITFAPALSGETISIRAQESPLLNDTTGLAIDASALPRGITIVRAINSGAQILKASNGAHLRGLTFQGGVHSAIINESAQPLIISRCTFRQNAATTGGAITASNANTVLSQCTFSGNSSSASGGAISISGGRLTMHHCTVSGNSCTGGPGGGVVLAGTLAFLSNNIITNNAATSDGDDIYNLSSIIYYEGANMVLDIGTNNGFSTGPLPVLQSGQLSSLTDNGGPTWTMATKPASYARNHAVGSSVTTDQRGRAVINGADIGAYETQPGVVVLLPGESASEALGGKTITARREGGAEGTVTVKISASAGTAAASSDFTPFTNETLTFTDGQINASKFVSIIQDSVVEANETINVSLSSPTGGAVLGSPAATTITIVDPSSTSQATDTVPPSFPVITSPAFGATMDWNGSITVSGTASDNKGVASVTVAILDSHGGAFTIPAVLDAPGAATTKWSCTYSNPSESDAYMQFRASATDVSGRSVAFSTFHTIYFRHPLVVDVLGKGTVSPAGYIRRSYREPALSYTISAIPSPGYIFNNWNINGATNTEVGVTPGQLSFPTLSFYHRPGLQITAIFAPSPASRPGFSGLFRGLIESPAPTLSTEGVAEVNISATGAFSAKIMMDGGVMNCAGYFDSVGTARFGTARSVYCYLPRSGKPSIRVQLSYDNISQATVSPWLFASVALLDYRNQTVSVSGGSLRPLAGTLDPYFLGPNGANMPYTFHVGATSPLDPYFYPQGEGFGTLTLMKNRMAMITNCTLADGTTGLTASAALDDTGVASIYIPLYGNTGFYSTRLQFTNSVDSDFVGSNGRWGRPFIASSHYYRAGWPEILGSFVLGARYVVTPGQSVMRNVEGGPLPPVGNGNVTLRFSNGDLTYPITRKINLSGSDVVTKVPANDPTFSLSINRSTGSYNGSFFHEHGIMVPFQGIIYQKGAFGGGHGFFLSPMPSPIDYTGQSGGAEIYAVPP